MGDMSFICDSYTHQESTFQRSLTVDDPKTTWEKPPFKVHISHDKPKNYEVREF